MRLATTLAEVRRHPRHVILFAATTGLVLGPLSPAATILAAVLASALAAAAGRLHGVASAPPDPLDPSAPHGPVPSGDRGGAKDPASPHDRGDAAAAVSSREPAFDLDSSRSRSATSPALVLAAAAAVLVGALVADARIAAIEGGPLARMHGRAVAASAVILEPVRERVGGPAVARARLVGGALDGEVAVLRVRSAAHPGEWPGVGEVVAIEGKAAPLGLFDAYQRRRGAQAAIEVSRLTPTGRRRGGPAGLVDAARRRAEAGLVRGLAEPEAALLRGMVLGQDEQLAEEVRDEFKRSGLAHILAVSGQNVMLLATLVLGAGAALGVGLRARLLWALALVAIYVPLTGAGPSIQRAGVMGAAGLVAALAGRPAHRWYALGLAAVVTLALNPRASGEPGWQLSFAAVIALLALVPPMREPLARRMPRPVADVAAMTVAATIGTAPLMALHFGQVSLAALPANLLAAAAIAPVMWLGMLAAAAAQIAPALAAPFNAANAPLLAFVEWVAHAMAGVPAAVMPVRLGSPAALAAAYAALTAAIIGVRAACRHAAAAARDGASMDEPAAVEDPSSMEEPAGAGRWSSMEATGLAAARNGSQVEEPAGRGSLPRPAPGADSRSPANVRRPRRRVPWARVVRLAGVVAAVPIAVLVFAAAIDAGTVGPPRPGELVISFLNVGQGDATLLRTDGVAVLVDTGPPDGPILRRLAEAGVRRLDALVLTHAQTDHEGAALAILRHVRTRLVLNGGAGWPSAVQRGLPTALGAAHARQVPVHAGQVLTLGAIRMRVLWPPAPPPDFRPEGDPNERAIVAHVEWHGFDLLLPADAETNVTGPLQIPELEALKVAHHGSDDAGLPALLERTDPEFAAIEVGAGNTYGHPTASTLAALRTVDHVYRTDRDGTVHLRVKDDAVTVERSP